jgi:hypothetical protein
MELNYYKQVKEMRSEIFRHMLETRGSKYRSFLRYLRFFKYVSFTPKKGEFLESFYALMRYLDDVVDGDIPIPESYLNESDYISGKIGFSQNPISPKDAVDFLMVYCFDLASSFEEDFQQETIDILHSLLFDAKRRGKKNIFPKEELYHHFHLLDIRGTIRATLKIFGDNPDKYNLLEPLGKACRHQYNIEDFEADIAAGYINIPMEECTSFGIEMEDLGNVTSPKIQSWLRHHAHEGLEFLKEHHRLMPEGAFTLFERAVFKVVYENPAKRVFMKVLANGGSSLPTNMFNNIG